MHTCDFCHVKSLSLKSQVILAGSIFIAYIVHNETKVCTSPNMQDVDVPHDHTFLRSHSVLLIH